MRIKYISGADNRLPAGEAYRLMMSYSVTKNIYTIQLIEHICLIVLNFT